MPDVIEKHVMFDLETLGTTPNAVVMEIGAVAFDPYGQLLGDMKEFEPGTFYRAINIQSCLKLGMEVDGSTILWWLGQDEEARKRIIDATPVELGMAMSALTKFLEEQKPAYVWSHGASFDIVILETIYRRLRHPIPWTYKQIRDTRTLFSVADITQPAWDILMRRPFKHHPTSDAWAQARAVQFCLGDHGNETGPTEAITRTGSLAA